MNKTTSYIRGISFLLSVILFGILITSISWARLGETIEQCEERYGKPIDDSRNYSYERTYIKDNFIIRAEFNSKEKCCSIKFSKTSIDGREALAEANGDIKSVKTVKVGFAEAEGLLRANNLSSENQWYFQGTKENFTADIMGDSSDVSYIWVLNSNSNNSKIAQASLYRGLTIITAEHQEIMREAYRRATTEKLKGF